MSAAKKIPVSNAPPFIKNDDLWKALSRHGQIVSPIRMVLLGCKSPKLKHVVCHRRQLYMVLKDSAGHLELTLNFNIEGFNYVVFVTSSVLAVGLKGTSVGLVPEAGERMLVLRAWGRRRVVTGQWPRSGLWE